VAFKNFGNAFDTLLSELVAIIGIKLVVKRIFITDSIRKNQESDQKKADCKRISLKKPGIDRIFGLYGRFRV
jgi:hypothetical protein